MPAPSPAAPSPVDSRCRERLQDSVEAVRMNAAILRAKRRADHRVRQVVRSKGISPLNLVYLTLASPNNLEVDLAGHGRRRHGYKDP